MTKDNSPIKALVLEDDGRRISAFTKIFYKLKWDYTFYREAKQVIDVLDAGLIKFDIIFLDHDLGGETYVDTNEKNTGSEVARWISNNREKVKKIPIIIHSLNTVGQIYMRNLIPGAHIIPYIWEEDTFKKYVKFRE